MSDVVNYGSAFGGIVAPQVTYKDFTVAPDDATDTSGYDFENLTKALEYVKQTGSQKYQSFGVRLVLGDGNFSWNRSDILREGLWYNSPNIYHAILEYVNLHIIGNGEDNTTLDFKNGSWDMCLVYSNMQWTGLKVTSTDSKGYIAIDGMYSRLGIYDSHCIDIIPYAHIQANYYIDDDTTMEYVNYTTTSGVSLFSSTIISRATYVNADGGCAVDYGGLFIGFSSKGAKIRNDALLPNSIDNENNRFIDLDSKNPITMMEAVSDTDGRPDDPKTGQPHFDTDLGLPIWYNGSDWVDATGAVV